MGARQKPDTEAVWITKSAVALEVEVILLQTNTPKQNTVLPNAGIEFAGIKAVRECGTEPVYNMEVKRFHNFSVNGGIIVHNCMDDIRYFCFTILRKKVGKEEYESILR